MISGARENGVRWGRNPPEILARELVAPGVFSVANNSNIKKKKTQNNIPYQFELNTRTFVISQDSRVGVDSRAGGFSSSMMSTRTHMLSPSLFCSSPERFYLKVGSLWILRRLLGHRAMCVNLLISSRRKQKQESSLKQRIQVTSFSLIQPAPIVPIRKKIFILDSSS